MDQQRRIETLKEITAHSFSQAKAYTNVVLAAGYAGLFALWSTFAKEFSDSVKLISGLLIAFSLVLFLAWELFGMIARHRMLVGMTRVLSGAENFEGLLENQQARERNTQIAALRVWPFFLWPTVLSGFGAFFLLLWSFSMRLVRDSGLAVSWEGIEMSGSIAVVVGAAIAVLMGLAFQRMTIWNSQRLFRKNYASAIGDDLEASSELYVELKDFWQDKKTVLFSLIDEIANTRAVYDADRMNLYIMPNPQLRRDLARYYRQSSAALVSLRRDQTKIYELDEGPEGDEKRARLVSSIQFQFDRLDDLRLKAIELAGRTEGWN